MEYVKKFLEKSGQMAILEAIIFTVLGIVLVCQPGMTLRIIAIILGIIFFVIGAFKLIQYFTSKGKNDAFNYDLIYGLTAIAIGIVAMAYMNVIASVLRIIVGVWIIYTSFVRFNSTIQLKIANNRVWLYSLILALLMFVCGLYILVNTGAIIVTIGIAMIIYGVIDIVENIIFIKNIKTIL